MQKNRKSIKIGAGILSYEKCYEVLVDQQMIELDEVAMARVFESFYFLKEFIKDKLIYGINTGFGPMAQYKINNEDQIQLQYNLIRSHCSGSGNPIAVLNVKALMLARLNTLMRGYSGIHPDAVQLLKELINRDITPVIYEHGGLGASGDLVQLAHLALTLIGEGEVHYKGEIVETEKVFKAEGLKPLEVHIREGLALMNGTSAMCGIGLVNLIHAKNLLKLAVASTSMIVEMVESYDDHYSNELNSVKYHPGQNAIAKEMQVFLEDSKLIKKREKHLYNSPIKENILKDKVQEYYSIRCVPQILGPVLDTINYAEQVIVNEINSVSDNPIIDYENKNVFHGGNFHGDYASLEMDKLKISITRLSMLCERQLNFLLNDKLNGKLPPFVNLGTLGLNLGIQGVQFTATSTTAENQTLSFPMYVHSIPSNNDNQDIVSMGANAALIAQKVIFNTYEVIAIEFLAIIQAIDHLNLQTKISNNGLDYYTKLRELVPVFQKDHIKYKEQAKIATYLKSKV
ncbi:MAG: histidine ammonia-lyase [Bacteroidetes bacterium RIFCSPLOWO2_12_FULL_35_15]|nr:MAG: histidine ammonia-lyase [Bacteroidetes bacterium RIFCSPLOWO2_12_FULL_35_15]